MKIPIANSGRDLFLLVGGVDLDNSPRGNGAPPTAVVV